MKSLLIGVVCICLAGAAFGQQEINGGPVNVPVDGIIDGVFIQEHIPTKRLIPYEYVREADAVWSRRVWEYIDLREKINHSLYYPKDDITPGGVWVRNARRWSLWTVIRQHVLNGDLRVFYPDDPLQFGFGKKDGYELKYPLDPEPGMDFYSDSVFRTEVSRLIGQVGAQSDIPLTDEYGDPLLDTLPDGTITMVYPPPDTTWFTSEDMIQYRIKEDWFFDKERSVLDVRIIALAPVVYDIKEDQATGTKNIEGIRELFWLYFPHCRFVFNNYFVYNEQNDSQWMSYDDLFWKRRFNSVAYKESNVYDRDIESYRMGVDALWESEQIKNEIRNIEHDVWSF